MGFSVIVLVLIHYCVSIAAFVNVYPYLHFSLCNSDLCVCVCVCVCGRAVLIRLVHVLRCDLLQL